ncbi:MAG: response regulator [Planctomycetota bacterium]
MSDKTVLVIDDSATIRRLVDQHLSPVGYRVVLAPNAEEGIQVAGEIVPDLILLDHQLPGTTGYQVACALNEMPQLANTPVVVSSTLRKKAYVEYVDLDNVVDMLPKPYTEDLLRTTVANAIETAKMIVQSQSQGTAVPEVINQLDDASLAGTFECFGLRELLDFLNNGNKQGVLEAESENVRIRFHLDRGKIQAVYGAGLDAEATAGILDRLPESLSSLAPVLKMTINGRSCAEVDGFVQLLDQKVLDPRLMTKLVRYQAAMLVRLAFEGPLKSFRFEKASDESKLHKKLPLESSLLALLVEAATHFDAPEYAESAAFQRTAVRGQNLDRAGLSARHMKLLPMLSEARGMEELVVQLGWEASEVGQVLAGFIAAELVEQHQHAVAGQFVVLEPSPAAAQSIRDSLDVADKRYAGKVVRDKVALKLVLQRAVPHTFLFAADDAANCELVKRLFATAHPKVDKVKRIAIGGSPDGDWQSTVGFVPDAFVGRPCTAEEMFAAMDQVFGTGRAEHETESAEQVAHAAEQQANPAEQQANPAEQQANPAEQEVYPVEQEAVADFRALATPAYPGADSYPATDSYRATDSQPPAEPASDPSPAITPRIAPEFPASNEVSA